MAMCPSCGARWGATNADELGMWLRTLVQRALNNPLSMRYDPMCSGVGCQALAESMLDEYVRIRNRAYLPAIRAEEI